MALNLQSLGGLEALKSSLVYIGSIIFGIFQIKLFAC